MGTKIYRESYMPGYQYHSVRNTNEIPTNWPLFYGNKTIQNGEKCNAILPGTVANLFSGYEKETLRQMMLTHEAAFKHQVSELHRLYKVQKEIMIEIKRTVLYKHIEKPPSSSSLVHRVSYEDTLMRWHKSPLPMVESNDCEILESRPSKAARKQLFNIHFTADNYIDVEEETTVPENKISGILSNSCTRNNKADMEIGERLDSKVQFFDLNEPSRDDDVDVTSTFVLLQKNNNVREQILNINSAGITEPRSEFITMVPQDNSSIYTQLVYSQSSKVGDSISDNPCLPKSEKKIGLIDINLVYEVDAEVAETEKEKIAADFGAHIDLNLCAIEEDEITSLPSCPSTSIEQPRDEADIFAAKALVAISSVINIDHFEESTHDPSEGTFEDTLLWFSKIASSHSETLESDTRSASKEIDEFEAMTLRLIELKEEEYMPKQTPLVFQNLEMEIENNNLSSRARRGKARRGGQKRDFQRDILPGITSLSRHEVAEDVHAFGKIMKAMGHNLAKKNSSSRRGRRRLFDDVPLVEPRVTYKPLMEQIDSVEIGLEERVLTGWGEIPRRPRRRRCHVGNLSSTALS